MLNRLAPLLAFALALVWIGVFHERALDPSDEAEWSAVSIAHARQLMGEEPPGTQRQREAGELEENRWKRGVQATTFGYKNPCVPKMIWGAAAVIAGHPNAGANVFQIFNQRNGQKRARAVAKLEPVYPLLRWVTAVFCAGCAALLFSIGRRLAFGNQIGGWITALAAWALWLMSPLIGSWSNFIRPDFFMLFFALACLNYAMAWSERRQDEPDPTMKDTRRALTLGALAGLCVASKFNGALAAFFVGAALLLLALDDQRTLAARLKTFSYNSVLAGMACLAVLWVTSPVLWTEPGQFSETLAFWKKHMTLQQRNLEAGGGIAARSLAERFDLALLRIPQHEPLHAVTGLPGTWALALAGFALLLWQAIAKQRLAAGIALTWAAVFFVGTTLWLPLDWARYFFPYQAAIVIGLAGLIGCLAQIRNRSQEGPENQRLPNQA